MKFRMYRTLKLGPLRLHLTERGIGSWGLQVGRWSWNARSGRHTVDTPGWGYVQSRGRRPGPPGCPGTKAPSRSTGTAMPVSSSAATATSSG